MRDDFSFVVSSPLGSERCSNLLSCLPQFLLQAALQRYARACVGPEPPKKAEFVRRGR
jgi:hypothetical protein